MVTFSRARGRRVVRARQKLECGGSRTRAERPEAAARLSSEPRWQAGTKGEQELSEVLKMANNCSDLLQCPYLARLYAFGLVFRTIGSAD